MSRDASLSCDHGPEHVWDCGLLAKSTLLVAASRLLAIHTIVREHCGLNGKSTVLIAA